MKALLINSKEYFAFRLPYFSKEINYLSELIRILESINYQMANF